MVNPAPIQNGKDTPLNVQTGTIPQVDGAMFDWFQPLVFSPIVKTIANFQVLETAAPVYFRGVVMPLSGRQLEIKPEAQRAWDWIIVFSQTALPLQPDDVIFFLEKQCRIMSQKSFALYGYFQYEMVQDWQGAGPI